MSQFGKVKLDLEFIFQNGIRSIYHNKSFIDLTI